jgi:hypothetical protein
MIIFFLGYILGVRAERFDMKGGNVGGFYVKESKKEKCECPPPPAAGVKIEI